MREFHFGNLTNTLLIGNVMDVLDLIEDQTFNMIVTSPPYYGLRAYGIPRTVWGGDPTCLHFWVPINTRRPNQSGGASKKQNSHPGSFAVAYDDRTSSSCYCEKCGAWLGVYGDEPTVQEYVQHTVLICRKLWRVLRDDGVLWWNIGDSMAGSGGAGGDYGAGGLKDGQPKYRGTKRQQSGEGFIIPDKSLMLIPERVSIALQEDGWIVRGRIIWHKLGPMPESPSDRCGRTHEHIYMLTKKPHYWWDWRAVAVPAKYPGHDRGRYGDSRRGKGKKVNSVSGVTGELRRLRDVWTPSIEPFRYKMCEACGTIFDGREYLHLVRINKGTEAKPKWSRICTCGRDDAWMSHYAAFSPTLIEPCIKSSIPEGGLGLDPFSGTGTTIVTANRHQRVAAGIELSPKYAKLTKRRLVDEGVVSSIIEPARRISAGLSVMNPLLGIESSEATN